MILAGDKSMTNRKYTKNNAKKEEQSQPTEFNVTGRISNKYLQ